MLASPLSLPASIADRVATADWLEATMLIGNISHASRADVRSALKSAAENQEELDVLVDLTFREVARRAQFAPRGYPFKPDVGGISLDSAIDALGYAFMLCLSVSQFLRAERRQQEVEVMFDSLVADALAAYLGPNSVSLRFGTPVSGGRPTVFLDALRWLCEKMRLTLGPACRKKPKRNDGGVDVVAWTPFPDTRSGFITILAQCTVQIDWRPKARDISEDLWRGWVDFGRSPLTCIAVPFVISHNYDKWDEVRRTSGIVLERLRIIELVAQGSVSARSDIASWVAAEALMMRAGGSRATRAKRKRRRQSIRARRAICRLRYS
jgi:hypothetical protein